MIKSILIPALCLTALPATLWAGDGPLLEALVAHQGKGVTVMLSSGQELSGRVKTVDEDGVVLTELRGKEFFDAAIDLDEVEAVVYRVRDR